MICSQVVTLYPIGGDPCHPFQANHDEEDIFAYVEGSTVVRLESLTYTNRLNRYHG